MVSILLAAGLGAIPVLPGGTDKLTVQALEAVAQIAPDATGERRIHAPSVTFSLRVDFGCSDSAVASLSIGIADTHYRYVPPEGDAAILAEIDVSAEQIAPITTGEFCVVGEPEDGAALLLHGVATAQVALLCTDDEHTEMRIASAALPLRLVCVTGVDQEVSPASD